MINIHLHLTPPQWLALFDVLSMHVEDERALDLYDDPEVESPTLTILEPLVDAMAVRLAAMADEDHPTQEHQP